MKLLIICAGDRSTHDIALNVIKYLNKTDDDLTVCVLDKNKEIKKYLKKNKIKFLDKNFDNFFKAVKKDEYNWLLNIWGFQIFKKDFLSKFKNNLNLHPLIYLLTRKRSILLFSIK